MIQSWNIGLFFTLPLLVAIFHFAPLSTAGRRWLNSMLVATLSVFIWAWSQSDLPQLLLVGGWPHFAGIQWSLDELSLVLLGATLLVYWPASWALSHRSPQMNVIFHFVLAACFGLILSADLFNIYVMLEILTLASALLFIENKSLSKLKTYVWMNVVGSVFYLFAIVYLYQNLGTMNLIDIGLKWNVFAANSLLPNLIIASLCFAFILKAAIFPLNIWLPEAYALLPKEVQPFMNAVPTKVAIYLMFRLTSSVGTGSMLQPIFVLLGSTSLIVGALGLLSKKGLISNLLYFNLSHLGVMLLILTLPNPAESLLYYLAFDILVVNALFVLGNQMHDSDRGLILQGPLFLTVVGIILMSAIGLPPFGGFWAEVLVIRQTISQPMLALLILSLTFISILFALRFWATHFVGPDVEARESTHTGPHQRMVNFNLIYSSALLALFSIVSIWTYDWAIVWGEQIQKPQRHFEKILQQPPSRAVPTLELEEVP